MTYFRLTCVAAAAVLLVACGGSDDPARGALIDAHLDPARVIVRVNALGTTDFDVDMATLSQTDFRRIMVPKAESAKKIVRIDTRFEVIALCETARGVVAADKLAAAPNVVGQPQNILLSVNSSAWTSMPITGSYSVIVPPNYRAAGHTSGVRRCQSVDCS